ncbi:MAG: YebC/PmpR family DNA-binding transcriptional regulator [Candidatus Sumerlaeaceae bacterium]|nr:YebC/PmpR family DNA-binding transcriptional regulator [Candidatus Sumerlaeaceae bacterium]
MSGHSKWHSIKHKKAAIDAKRGKVFTRIIRELTIAARLGGGDINSNPRLRTAVAAAKDVNMPSKNIDAAIKKGTGELEGANYEEVTYEGYGPGGVAVLVDATTDNRNRTTAEIRHCFSKYNGSMGAVGSVAYLFSKQGIIRIASEGINEDKLIEAGLEAGADDVRNEGEIFVVATSPNVMQVVREKLEAGGFKIETAEVENIPSTTKQLEGKEAESCLKLMGMLEELDDVKSVSANFDISDELIEQFQ